MQTAFRKSGSPAPRLFPFTYTISFPQNKDGWIFGQTRCKTAEDWINHASAELEGFGVGNFYYKTLTPRSKGIAAEIQYSFESEYNRLKFIKLAFGDRRMQYTIPIPVQSKTDRDIIHRNVLKYLNANEMDASTIYDAANKRILITTNTVLDAMKIFANIERETFGQRLYHRDPTTPPHLLDLAEVIGERQT